MEKVKNIRYTNKKDVTGGHYSTGLILELEDGTFLRHQSTDPIMTFEVFVLSQPEACSK